MLTILSLLFWMIAGYLLLAFSIFELSITYTKQTAVLIVLLG